MTTATTEATKKRRTRRAMPVAVMMVRGREADGDVWELWSNHCDTVAEAEKVLADAPPGRYMIVRIAGTYDVEEVKAKAVKRT